MSLFLELHQYSQINQANDSASRAHSSAERANNKTEELSRKIDRLLLINEALWRIIKQKLDLDDNDLSEIVTEIDAEDGHINGKKAKSKPISCSHCNRILPRKSNKCIYCGGLTLTDVFR